MKVSNKELLKLREDILSAADLTKEMEDEEVWHLICERCRNFAKERMLTLKEQEALKQHLFHSLRRLDVLQDLLDDEEITEIMVNGPERIFYEKGGGIYRSDRSFGSNEKLNDVIQQMAGTNNRMVNESCPIVDTRLKDGSRVNIVLAPISIDGAAVSIRKFPKKPLLMEELVQMRVPADTA